MTTATPELSVFVERKPGWIVELTVEAPPEDLDRALGEASRKLGARLRIPGFRPGKAPAVLVERVVGWEALRNAAAEDLIPRLYGRAVEQEELDPVGDPSLTIGTLERGQPVKFSAEVAVRPVVDLGDHLSLRVDRRHTEVTEADVELRRRGGPAGSLRPRRGEPAGPGRGRPALRPGDATRGGGALRG